MMNDYCDCPTPAEGEEFEITACATCGEPPSFMSMYSGENEDGPVHHCEIHCEGCGLRVSGDITQATSAWNLRNIAITEAMEDLTTPCVMCSEEIETGDTFIMVEEGRAHLDCVTSASIETTLEVLGLSDSSMLLGAIGMDCHVQPDISEDEDEE